MTYDSAYDAVSDLYDPEAGWDDLVTVGDRTGLNLGEEALGRHGDSDRTGLRIRDFESGETETYTFAELDAAANRVANYLVGHTERGDRVGAMLPARLELYAVVFGTLKAGRVYVPLAPVFGPDALNYRLDDSGAAVLFAERAGLEAFDPEAAPSLDRVVLVGDGEGTRGGDMGGATVEPYPVVEGHGDEFDAVDTHPADPFTVTYTSGTTGQPKGIPSAHRSPVRLHSYIRHVVDLRSDDVYFVAASPAWSYGLQMGTIAAGLVGTAIGCYRGRFDPDAFFGTLDDFGVTNAMVPPTALRQSRGAGVDLREYDVDLRVLLSAGEALDAETVRWCEEGLGAPPQDAYGLTEAGMLVCNYAFGDWEVRPGSMGKPIPGRTVALLDEAGDPVEQGEVGEVAVERHPEDSGEYWGRPAASARRFGGRWLRTGDLAREDEDGYWWYESRADNVIVSAGYRIGPEEVESTLMNHEAVVEAAVVGVPDETRGERVRAYVTLREGVAGDEELAEEVVGFARRELSKHEYPREVRFLDELPKTATGKIQRAVLADRAAAED
ncbi:acyl-CoA synthetase [Halomarina litorea]|uniref:acyl-CoA synthetase n=1 Tax=Halomarina litorea TaxID=2961595 RepID=UPI0020C4F355|nr:AMP-binding protein [Halomarina sp. BCD28]